VPSGPLTQLPFHVLVTEQPDPSITSQRTTRWGDTVGRALIGKGPSEATRKSLAFSVLVKAAYRLVTAEIARTPELTPLMFKTAQWARGSEAAAALAQMAAPQTKGGTPLAMLVRERQDLVREWQARDIWQIAAQSISPNKRSGEAEQALSNRLATIGARIAEIDMKLQEKFPE
jgi:hypothetical protein